MRTTSCASLLPIAVAMLTAATTAQQWQLTDGGGPGSSRGGIAYDEVRGQMVRFGGEYVVNLPHSETRVFDGTRWLPATSPGALKPTGVRGPVLMTWDDVRDAVLLCNDASGELWQWNGGNWAQSTVSPHPAAGDGSAFAFDRARGVAVFMGASGTWEWNGSTWTHAAAATQTFVAAAFVPARGKVVPLANRDLFEWNGAAWTQLTTNLLPAATLPAYAMAFDSWRQRLVIFNTILQPAAVYEWDGVNLSTLVAAVTPPPRTGAVAAFDPARGRTLLCGGQLGQMGLSETWAWDGSAWTEIAVAPGAGVASLAFDSFRNRLVAAGVNVQQFPIPGTWERDASGWHLIAPGAQPGSGPMVFDAARNAVALCHLGSIWYWNGAIWTQTTAAAVPPVRPSFALAFDAARGEIALFGGGQPGGALLADTWLWNGSSWRQAAPAVSPPARFESAMAHDPLRQRTVLFGGSDAQHLSLGDTWEWDGTNWTSASPVSAPLAHARHAMAWDARQQMVAMTGGVSAVRIGGTTVTLQMPVEVWRYNGITWSVTAIAGPVLADHAMAFDLTRNLLVIQGGRMHWSYTATDDGVTSSDTYELATQPAAAAEVPFVTCGTLHPRLHPESLPTPGNTRFAAALSGAPVNTLVLLGLGTQLAITNLPGGCTFWTVSPVTLFGVTNTGGALRWALPVPNSTRLVGMRLVAQVAGLDSTGNLFLSTVLSSIVGE